MKFSIAIAVCIGIVQGAPLIALSQGAKAVPDSYIVVLKNHESASAFQSSFNTLALRLQTDVVKTEIVRQFNLIPAVHVRASPDAVKELQSHPDVEYIERDTIATISGTQHNPPSWGLTRISQRRLNLAQPYLYGKSAGENVKVFVLDTGILKNHTDFGGRAEMGTNTIDNFNYDQNGHGTYVSGIIGGTTYGVAKKVKIIGVKVLDANGQGTLSSIIDGLNWIAVASGGKASVVNMSLNFPKNRAIDDAVARVVDRGIHVIASAGNFPDIDSCDQSPGGSGVVTTVGASDDTDTIASFSSTGRCVSLFAPGVNITSSWIDSPDAMKSLSGSSAAAAHVTGVTALFISAYGNRSPRAMRVAIQKAATRGVLKGKTISGTPNLLVFNSRSRKHP